MVGLTSLKVYSSLFNETEQKNKFQLYASSLDDEFSFAELKDKVAEVLGLSHISPEEHQHDLHGPHIIETYRKV